jgi:proliferating cell nuclear antigen
MFEAKLVDGNILRKIVDSIKDLVTDVNLEVSANGISLQAMDSSHVALVQLKLDKSGFSVYKCDKPITLGLSITNLAKVLRLVTGNDSITLKCDSVNEPNAMHIICESSK